MPEAKKSAPKMMRYPLDAFEEDTDYLKINTVNYIPPGSGSNPKSVTLNYDFRRKNPDYIPEREVNGQTVPAVGDEFIGDDKGFIEGDLADRYTRKGRYRNKNVKNNEETIFLPIPSNIQDGNSVKYTEGELDGLTANILNFVTTSINSGGEMRSISDISPFISNFLKRGTDTITDPSVYSHFIRSIAAQAANIPFGGNLTASQLLARQEGNIVNPNMELLFDGVTLRTFKFSFKMTPRGKDEMEQIKKIIRHFKKSMTPSSSGNVYLSTPKVFQLSYMKGRNPHPFLHRFKPCALTDCSVNYTGEANYATYQDGTPVSMVMDLGFKELEPIYADDYSNLDGDGNPKPYNKHHQHFGGVGY